MANAISNLVRCQWPTKSALLLEYHDKEWGVPLHDDQRLFEFLVLDAMQAGLSWEIILKKREGFRRAFHAFDPTKVAQYGEEEVQRLLGDAGIIRNRLKILAAITNARRFLELQREFGSFDAYIWRFVEGAPLVHQYRTLAELPATSSESDAMSKELMRKGFKFVGSTICYAFMQAAGMVNDHAVDCFRYQEIAMV